MCIFSRQVQLVAATKIFARTLADGRQALVYAMDVAAAEPLAMVLPLPVPANGPDDAVEFVSLEDYANLFDELKKAFPESVSFGAHSLGRGPPVASAVKLVVHRVGAFEASYVPSAKDFDRLDSRFRLPPSVLGALPQYADYGFAVFQLRAGARSTIHPMAMRFPRRDGALYFPTVHVHDGTVPERANFDHQLYAQFDPVVERLAEWTASSTPLHQVVDVERARGLIDGHASASTQFFMGSLPNRDLVFAPPPVGLDDLSGAGESYSYAVRASYHYALESHPSYPRWLETSRNKLRQLCTGLNRGLAELTSQNARAWQLGPLSETLPPHFMNGQQLWHGTDYMHGGAASGGGPGRIAFTPFGQLVEPQRISLGFSELPTQEDARAINWALGQLLDRVVSG